MLSLRQSGLPGLTIGGGGVIVGVGGLHNGVVGPVVLRQIHEADQLIRIAVNVRSSTIISYMSIRLLL